MNTTGAALQFQLKMGLTPVRPSYSYSSQERAESNVPVGHYQTVHIAAHLSQIRLKRKQQ